MELKILLKFERDARGRQSIANLLLNLEVNYTLPPLVGAAATISDVS